MSTHNICFYAEMRKISIVEKKVEKSAMHNLYIFMEK